MEEIQVEAQDAVGGADQARPGYHRWRHSQMVFNQATAVARQMLSFDGKRMRKAIQRRTVDYNSTIIRHLEARGWQRDRRDFYAMQPDPNFVINLLPPFSFPHNPSTSIATKFVHTSTNKNRYPVNCCRWTPEGRRLVTGSASGEFTLWNGLTFNFETILQAHDTAVRAMVWSHNDTWMVTADHQGYIKYWQSNMNNLKVVKGHNEVVRDLTFCPSDSKFASCSDDSTIKIWDFTEAVAEQTLTGHGWDVRCIDWHPTKALLASGSKDNLVKLWDPKSGKSLTTLHGHKNTIVGLEWNRNGNWIVTASRDQLLRVYDIRTMKEMQAFRGHKKEVTCVSWHPQHESLFGSGGSDGAIMFWMCGTENSVGGMESAHESHVFALDWHPLGHILVSGSNDHTTRFWTRNRPGDNMQDRFSMSRSDAEALGLTEEDQEAEDEEQQHHHQQQQQQGIGLGSFGMGDVQLPGLGDAKPGRVDAIPGMGGGGGGGRRPSPPSFRGDDGGQPPWGGRGEGRDEWRQGDGGGRGGYRGNREPRERPGGGGGGFRERRGGGGDRGGHRGRDGPLPQGGSPDRDRRGPRGGDGGRDDRRGGGRGGGGPDRFRRPFSPAGAPYPPTGSQQSAPGRGGGGYGNTSGPSQQYPPRDAPHEGGAPSGSNLSQADIQQQLMQQFAARGIKVPPGLLNAFSGQQPPPGSM